MTDRAPKNTVASIHRRLLNVSKKTGRAFNDLVIYYAIERFLYRLSQSRYADRVVLKGGLMLQVWNTPITRVTRDIDLLGKVSNDPDRIREAVRAICATAVDDDGLAFDPGTVMTSRIAEDGAYEGVRATFKGRFGKVPLAMQVDFGFSDVITPEPAHITYPSVLGHPPAQLLAYNRETAVAEKFEAMTKLGELNSRMRDFFDVWVLARSFAFDGQALAEAIRATFAHRGTEVEVEPVCFAERFTSAPAKVAQWKGFIKTSRMRNTAMEFAEVVMRVREFLQPVAEAIVGGRQHDRQWQPGGAWAER
ncbi:MAG TPA: nucleotidyl transferase AbiEii/AbiGii toxin family protein [Phycisphaerae bacterium]|nr:nucleotidyl transferase AbiEii/AbiGii toxin family protein [Phycisphaerae bacterium]